MAKAAILTVLEQTIGKYVENLDAQSLDLALWSGKIELGSLSLDAGAINEHLAALTGAAPSLRVISGSFHSLRVDIPWAQLTRRSVTLHAEGLELWLEPFDYQAAFSRRKAMCLEESLRRRRDEISRGDDIRKSMSSLRDMAILAGSEEFNESDESNESSKRSTSLAERLVRKIAANVQIDIKNVVFGIEGYGAKTGLCLDSISIYTTDDRGMRTFVNEPQDNLFKTVAVSGLALFCDDCYPDDLEEQQPQQEQEQPQLQNNSQEIYNKVQHSYLMNPLSFHFHLEMHGKSKYKLSADFPDATFLLQREQLLKIDSLATATSSPCNKTHLQHQPLFPEYRPTVPIKKGTAKIWWKYVLRCIGRLTRRRSWMEFYLAYRKRKAYISLYRRFAHTKEHSSLIPLSNEEKLQMQSIEDDLSISVEALLLWRDIADSMMRVNKKKKQKKTHHWSIFGNSKNDSLVPLTVEQIQQLESAVLANDNDDDDDAVVAELYDVSITLGLFQFDLISEQTTPLVSVELADASLFFKGKTDGSFDFRYSVTQCNVRDQSLPNTLFPLLLRTLPTPPSSSPSSSSPTLPTSSSSSSSSLPTSSPLSNETPPFTSSSSIALQIHLSKNEDGDQFVQFQLAPLECIVPPETIPKILQFVTLQRPSSRPNVIDRMYDAATEFVTSDAVSTALADAWKRQSDATLSLHMIVHAPVLVIPENSTNEHAHAMVVNFGTFDVRSVQSCSEVEAWSSSSEDIDIFCIQAENMRVYVGNAKSLYQKDDNGHDNDRNNTVDDISCNDEILHPVSFTMNVGIASSPSYCVFGTIPIISLQLSPSLIGRVINICNSLSNSFAFKKTQEYESFDSNILFVEDESSQQDSDQPKREELLHLQWTLRKLSLRLLTDHGDSIEAVLVSAVTQITSYNDGSIRSNLSMGWFWILDWLNSESKRQQRLIAHSRLPRPALQYAIDGKYNVFETIDGAHDPNHDKLNNLANIDFDLLDESITLNANFSDLFLNINPNAVVRILKLLSEMNGAIETKPTIQFETPSTTISKRVSYSCHTSLFRISLRSATQDDEVFCFEMDGASMKHESYNSSLVTLDVSKMTFSDALTQIFGPLDENNQDSFLSFSYGVNDGDASIDFHMGRTKMSFSPDTVKTSYQWIGEWSSPQLQNSVSTNVIADQEMPSSINHSHKKIDVSASIAVIQIMFIQQAALVTENPVHAPGVVLRGEYSLNINLETNDANHISKARVRAIVSRCQIYLARDSPVQVLEPVDGAFTANFNHGEIEEIDFTIAILNEIIMDVSIQNYANLIAALEDINSAFEPPRRDSIQSESLGDAEHNRMKRLASQDTGDDLERATPVTDGPVQCTRRVNFGASIPKILITIINDLNGIDDALLRVVLGTSGSELTGELAMFAVEPPSFFFSAHTSLSADYFDKKWDAWQPFFTYPWDIHCKGSRQRELQWGATSFSIDSNECHCAVSESFVVSLGTAWRMWKTYHRATEETCKLFEKEMCHSSSTQILASGAALEIMSNSPYRLINDSGIFLEFKQSGVRRECPIGSSVGFEFDLAPALGDGGKRKYGQDVTSFKEITLFIKKHVVRIPHVDAEIGRPVRRTRIGEDKCLFIDVNRTRHATVIHVRSQILLHNSTSLPMGIFAGDSRTLIGELDILGRTQLGWTASVSKMSHLRKSSQRTNKNSSTFGFPPEYIHISEDDCNHETSVLEDVFIAPSSKVTCCMSLAISNISSLLDSNELSYQLFQVRCESDEGQEPQVFNIRCVATSVTGQPMVDVFIEPRAIFINSTPLDIDIRSSDSSFIRRQVSETKTSNIVRLAPTESAEIFSSLDHASVCVRCADETVSGAPFDWVEVKPLPMDGSNIPWINMQEYTFQATEVMDKVFAPFFIATISNNQHGGSFPEGREEISTIESQVISQVIKATTFGGTAHVLSAFNIAAFHHSTNTMELRIPMKNEPQDMMLAKFSIRNACIAFLPKATTSICIDRKSNKGPKTTLPFPITDISLNAGGSHDFTPLLWKDRTSTGCYAYRKLNEIYEYEVHIVPEFVVFNGDEEFSVVVTYGDNNQMSVEPGNSLPLNFIDSKRGLTLSLEYRSLDAKTKNVRVDMLGFKVFELYCSSTGSTVGNIAVETILAKVDARFAIKLGGVTVGGSSNDGFSKIPPSDGKLRYSFDLSKLYINLHGSELALNSNDDKMMSRASNDDTDEADEGSSSISPYSRISQIILFHSHFNYESNLEASAALENDDNDPRHLFRRQSQLSSLCRNLQILDCTERTMPSASIIFDSTGGSEQSNFFDLQIMMHDEAQNVISVDLARLSISRSDGKSNPVIMSMSEDFMWDVIDATDRIKSATNELAGVNITFEQIQDSDEYLVRVEDTSSQKNEPLEVSEIHVAPKLDTLYNFKWVEVSPISLLVTFHRRPQISRYKHTRGAGSRLTNYFTQHLKFSINEAQLRLQGYKVRDIKGINPLVENLEAFYIAQVKWKIVNLLSAASFQDWKLLTGREDHGDEYVEGDILRLTGNLTGKSVGFALKHTTGAIGGGISGVTKVVGGGIHEATKLVGAGVVGKGVNTALTGAGEGLGGAISGVGSGASKIVQGTAQGIGDVAGGVGGAVLLTAQGKLGQGGKSLTEGVTRGAKTVVRETVEGVEEAGVGVINGVRSTLRGICHALSCRGDDGSICSSCIIS